MALSLYIHIPFCEVKCGYCDFFSVPRGYEDFDLQKEYVDALVREIDERSGEFPKRAVHSIFFGGGTPSLLDPRLLERVVDALARHFSWDPTTEITLETNPKTVSLEKLKAFRALGATRISIGVQSFQDRFLKILGRIHDGHDALKTVDDARRAGFDNVSCDLIFALPGQTFAEWKEDLSQAIALGTDHVSAYHLTIEKNTPFATLHAQGRLSLPPEDVGVEMLQWTRARLADAGFPAYEISNFAKPGRESAHNRNYWNYGDYLGFGTAAAGFMKFRELGSDSFRPSSPLGGRGEPLAGPPLYATRRHNVRNLKKYLEGSLLDFEDAIDRPTAMGEFCMLGLRTREGIDAAAFASAFGVSLEGVFPRELSRWRERGYLRTDGSRWSLTDDGFLFTDEIAASFLP